MGEWQDVWAVPRQVFRPGPDEGNALAGTGDCPDCGPWRQRLGGHGRRIAEALQGWKRDHDSKPVTVWWCTLPLRRQGAESVGGSERAGARPAEGEDDEGV